MICGLLNCPGKEEKQVVEMPHNGRTESASNAGTMDGEEMSECHSDVIDKMAMRLPANGQIC